MKQSCNRLFTNSRRSRQRATKRRSFLRQTSAVERLEQRNLLAALDAFLTTEHVDFTVGYSGGNWSLQYNDHDNFVLHDNDVGLVYVGPPAVTSRAPGPAFDFIGVEPAEDFYRLPQNQNADLLYLGVAALGTTPSDFDRFNPSAGSKGRASGLGRWLNINLLDVQHTTPSGAAGDGEFSVWQSGDVGPVVFMSSYDDGVSNPNGSGYDATDGIGPDDAIWVTAGGHLHYNYGFTQIGRYEVTVTLSGYVNDGNTTSLGQYIESEPFILYFSVGSVGELEFDASEYVVNEEAGTASVTVRRVGGSDGQLTVDYATSDGSALADTDYTETSDTLTFEDEETWKTITIPIVGDDVAESDETVGLALTDPGPANFNDYLIEVLGDANGILSAQATATLTITEAAAAADGPFDAKDNAFAVHSRNTLVGNVLFNDTDPNRAGIATTLATPPTSGTVLLDADGSFTYMPDSSFDVSDRFTYTVSDGGGELDTAIVTITAAEAQDFAAVLKKGHADVGVAYEDGAWDLHVHDEETDTEYEPDEVLLYVGPPAQSVRPVDAAFDFIGVGAGEGYWRLPDVDNPELLFLGIGGEELVAGTFQGGQVELHLKAVNGPGQFSVWQNTDTGPAVAMATSDGITTADSLSVLEGGHAHYNWGFTAQGGYEVTFEATGTLADGTAVASGDVTYFFEVPVAIDDAYTVGDGNQVVGNVLFNDIPPAGAALTAAVSTAPTKGTVVLDANGSFTYTPDGTFDGSDSFTYAVSDDGSELDSATVTIAAAAAQDFAAVLKMGHADVGVAYEDGAWDLHVHDEETDTEYEPGDVLLYVGPQAASDRAEGAAFDFIGVAAGETYWRLPDVDNPELLFLGIGGEELEAGTFLGGQVELHLKNVNGPGQFSVWQNTDTGPMVAMATSDGITGDDSLSVLEGGHAHYNWGFSETGSYRVTFEATGTLANGDVVHSGDVTYFFAVNPPVMSVTSLDSNSSGFVASFSADLGANGLNLFDTMADELGPADVTLVGSEVGAVAGSLIVDPALREVTFIKTGGPLAPDTYTVTLRSAADGFVDIAGQLFDGDGDGAEGDDYVTTFTIAEPAADTITLGIPDFVRGPGQPVNVPATAAGLPITLSDGENVQAVDLRIAYDPAMLSITGAEVAAGLPAGATVTVNTDTAGIAIIAFVSPSPLPAGTQTIINLQASIPSGIAGGTQRLELHEATVVDASSNQLPLLLDDGYQFVGYFGDVSGNGTINAIDASRVAQFAAQLDSGFSGALLTDPMILADISGNGRVNALDASLIAQFAALLDVPEIPPLPVQGTAVASGALAGIGTLLDHRDGDDPLETTRATTEPIANCDSPEDCSSYPPAVVDRLLAGSPEPAEATDSGSSEAWEMAVDELLGAIDEGTLLSD